MLTKKDNPSWKVILSVIIILLALLLWPKYTLTFIFSGLLSVLLVLWLQFHDKGKLN